MTGIVLRQPQHTHRERDVVVDVYGGWTASCTCGDEFAGADERRVRRSLSGHLSAAAKRLRALRWQVASGAPECVVSQSLRMEAK